METQNNFASFKAEILEMTAQNVDMLHAMWLRIFDTKTCGKFLHRLKDHAQTFYTDLLNESCEKQQTILDEIAALQAEARDLTRLLHESVDIGERPDDVPLVIWQLKLYKGIEHLREELARRQAEICELLLQQEQLCEELGELPLPLLADPLPQPEEMDAFRDHLEQLRAHRVLRLKEMDQLRQSIKHNMKLLECLPQTDQEERLLNQVDHCLTPETFERLRKMQKELADQMQEMRERIDDMREKIRVLWERLQETDDYAMRRVRNATEYTQYTYDVLREELQRCQALRKQNLESFIEQLRVEIQEWWDRTLKSPQERKRFTSHLNGFEREDVLELYEMELDGLKTFYSSNKKIFELYATRTELWSRMEALEAKVNDPKRFNNRGGQLLKEEKERKANSVKLPKIEEQITELVNAFVGQANTAFLVFGKDILKSMALDWEQFRQAKQQPAAARKNQELSGAVSKKMPPPHLTPKGKAGKYQSTSSLKKSPSKVDSSMAVKSTGNLKKRRHSNLGNASSPTATAAKRNLISSLDCNNSATVLAENSQRKPINPPKKVLVLEHSLRRGKRTNRLSAVNPSRSRAIPDILVEPPSSEDCGSL
ncbi:protein regulator of cytokinesis 1-like [Drosophila kikkawai]|uniref:Protein regulator of cytokinesis 1-like n=1 Tax=Drosophila kikkawai TaxID=30033 RepID=A0A6P4J3B4_DROKI|nr:protein regulator of cytokinesis 1-like [Drosophila kikkawai]